VLDKNDLLAFMLRQRLIGAGDVVHRKFSFADASRRHHNCHVSRERGRSFFVKQGTTAQKCEALSQEAGVYRLFHAPGGSAPITRYMPRFVLYDRRQHLLILEWVHDGETFRDYHVRTGRFPRELGRLAGRALAALHQFPLSNAFAQRTGGPRPPWALAMHRPDLSIFRDASSAALDVIRIVQDSPQFGQLLDVLASEWHASAWTHRDIKWENLVVSRSRKSKSVREVKIVDWELAGPGDPVWDAGSFMSSYLTFWLDSIPVTRDANPAESLPFAVYPLERMQEALGSFWHAYSRSMRWSPAEKAASLHRAVRYSAARLVQTVFEQMQSAAQLHGNVIFSLQLALNILQRPQEAAARLLGILPLAINATGTQ
jgi:aminoglycoside phosphotransferase (APT) family kinase protein